MWLRVYALVLRHLYLYRRSVTRIGDIFFWPVMNLLVWGFVTDYLQRMVLPKAVVFLIGGMIFWDLLYRSQQAITLSLSEEIWVRNIMNVFIAPVSILEIMVATCIVGVLKALAVMVVLGVLAYGLYAFNVLAMGWALVPFFSILLLFGWAVGMFTMGLALRFGHAAEALIWGIPFLIQPFSAVFYPVEVLPRWLQTVAYFMPSTYVFEGMRAVLQAGRLDLGTLAMAVWMNGLYLAGGAAFFGWMLHRVREKGLLSRLYLE